MRSTFLFAASLFVCNAVAFAPQAFIKRSTSNRKSSASGDFLIKPGERVKPKKHTRKGPTGIKPGDWLKRTDMVDAFIDPDYWLTWSFGLIGAFITLYHPNNADGSLSLLGVTGGTFHMLIAALLWVQTRRVRLVFEKDSFEFYNIKGPSLDFDKGAWLERKPDNYVSGTINRWKYDNITNWSFFPSLDYPLIVYFKETETPMEEWEKWHAIFDTYGEGQPHFFPGIVNARQMKEQMEMRGVKRKQVAAFKSMRQNLENEPLMNDPSPAI